MAIDKSARQIIRTIQNKIPIRGGLIRKSRETEQGFLSDIHNFVLEDGVLKFREGTRVMAETDNELWFDIQSFKFGDTEIVLGLNYKRELWGWLSKWPETSFKICDSSHFKKKKYKHVINGTTKHNNHFSFKRGNKFYMLEDNYSVIIINDYADIYRLMKNGVFKITADNDNSDTIQQARDDIDMIVGRIYLDIKNATNKVFEQRMYIGDEQIKNSHRITGETRFAWVNELGVISELSDPEYIDGYRHVVVSPFPISKARNKNISTGGLVLYQGTAKQDMRVWEHTKYAGWSIALGSMVGNKWQPTLSYNKGADVNGLLMAVKDPVYHKDLDSGTEHPFPKGVYLVLYAKPSGIGNTVPIQVEDKNYNYNAISFEARNIKSGEMHWFEFPVLGMDSDSFPAPVPVSMDDVIPLDTTETVELDKTKISMVKQDGSYKSQYIKLSNTYDADLFKEERHVVVHDDHHMIVFKGNMYFIKDFQVSTDSTSNMLNVEWHKYSIRAIEIQQNLSVFGQTYWSNGGYDTWSYKGWWQSVSISYVDLNKYMATLTAHVGDSDIALNSSEDDIREYMANADNRFAIWNNSHIQGISQRFFFDDSGIVYEGNFWEEEGNLNEMKDKLQIGYAPLMTLDYTGMRRIPMPMPMIRRAMRNPQLISMSGGKVYVVEDNKVWIGSVDDFMMIDYLEVHSTINHMATMDAGVVLATRTGLFYLEAGQGTKQVIGGENIMSKYLTPCSGGVLSVDGREIHIVYKHVTETGAWYPAVSKINKALTEINLEGEIKSVSIGSKIYVADDWNVWIYDMENKVWAGKEHYENRIHRLFVHRGKLGLAFETGVDRRKSFEREIDKA